MRKVVEAELSYVITGLCYRVHNELGRFGRERQYADRFEALLRERRFPYQREVALPGRPGFAGNQVDFLVAGRLLVDFKAKRHVTKEDYFQMQRYLRAAKRELGLIFNFRQSFLKPKRVLNTAAYVNHSDHSDAIRRFGSRSGFTVIEMLIVVFIVGTVVTGVFGLFVLSLRSAQEGERRVAGIALANERAEMIRNLPYEDVGTAGGVPAGTIPQTETALRNSVLYTVRTDVRYVDDPYDGVIGGTGEERCVQVCHKPVVGGSDTICVSQSALDAHVAHGDSVGPCEGGDDDADDAINIDYKQARVEVTWPSPNDVSPVLLITYVAPSGVEGGEAAGTLDFQALDAAAVGVQDATVRLVNGTVSPAIDITTETNREGRVVLPGLPPAADSYALTVSKNDFNTEQTFDATADFTPYPDYAHLTLVAGQVTSKTFLIDRLSRIDVRVRDDRNKKVKDLAFRLRGERALGENAAGEIVYAVDVNGQTDKQGESRHEDLRWDTYDFTIDGAATGYDIQETSVVLPLSLAPNTTLNLDVTVVNHTDQSAHVTVVDAAQQPVPNADVHLVGNGVDEEKSTSNYGQVFFSDLPGAGDYTVTVSASGFAEATQTVTVAGYTRAKVALANAG